MFTLSPYHLAIREALNASSSHLIIQAGPGSGKTTTGIKLVMPEMIRLIGRGMAVAFNKKNAAEIGNRLGGLSSSVTSGTVHGVCLAALRAARGGRVTVDGGRDKAGWDKYKQRMMPASPSKTVRLAREVVPTDDRDQYAATVAQYADECRKQALGLDGFPPLSLESIAEIIATHPEELPELFASWVLETVHRGLAERGTVDYSEMVYFPLIERVRFPRMGWVFFDEAQDISPLFLAAIMRWAEAGARIIAVGDPHQSINRFAGAMPDALEVLRGKLAAEVLPLPVSYRCSKAAAELANRIFPGAVEAFDGAAAGSVEEIKLSDLDVMELSEGDGCLSRTHRNIMPLAIKLLRERRPFFYKGAADIVAGMERVLWKAGAAKVADCGAAREKVSAWHDAEVQRMAEKGKSPHWLTAQGERVECLVFLLAATEADGGTVADVRRYFSRLLEAEKDSAGGVSLSTVHAAKGMEWATVYLLGGMQSPLAKTKEEQEAEACVEFVAVTRSKDRIVMVEV